MKPTQGLTAPNCLDLFALQSSKAFPPFSLYVPAHLSLPCTIDPIGECASLKMRYRFSCGGADMRRPQAAVARPSLPPATASNGLFFFSDVHYLASVLRNDIGK